MYIAIPVDKEDKNANIVKIAEAKAWAVIDFDDGLVKSVNFAKSWEEPGVDWLDFVILENRFENILDFMNMGIMVLVRRAGQDGIDDIMEAFKFKELDEAGF